MKKIILILAIYPIAQVSFAQLDTTKRIKTLPVQYCAEMRDGMLVVTADQKQITSL